MHGGKMMLRAELETQRFDENNFPNLAKLLTTLR